MTDFDLLVMTESPGLVAAVHAIIGDAHRAEEIVQDAFERCFQRWRRVSRLDRPGAWVRRVAINRAISVGRRSTVERRVLARVGPESGEIDPMGPDAFDRIHDGDIWASVRALPTEQAMAVALRYGADLGIDRIAETLGVSGSAVKSLLHRARTTLRSDERLRQHAIESEST